MNRTCALVFLLTAGIPVGHADDYVFFIRQTQMPDNLEWDVPVPQEGQIQSPLAINPGGARFELWSIRKAPLASYLLDSTYVNSYIPVSSVRVISEDPYQIIPRTRADRPFAVEIESNGLSSDPSAPPAARSLKLLRHVQAYPVGSSLEEINPDQATLLSEGSITKNGTIMLEYPVTAIPGADRTKVRGEERFSVFSLEDYQAPESQIDSVTVQIWPMTTHTLTGIEDGQVIRASAPVLEVSYKDLYPDSWTYLQVYKGPPAIGTAGVMVPGSSIMVDAVVPQDQILQIKELDSVVRQDGKWTLEVITVSPFGTDRLQYLSFEVARTLRINSELNTVK